MLSRCIEKLKMLYAAFQKTQEMRAREILKRHRYDAYL